MTAAQAATNVVRSFRDMMHLKKVAGDIRSTADVALGSPLHGMAAEGIAQAGEETRPVVAAPLARQPHVQRSGSYR
jgi:hypothetical protein